MTLSPSAASATCSVSWSCWLRKVWSKFAQRPLDRFLSLDPIQQRQLLRTLLLVIAIRLGLWTIRFRLLRQIAEKISTARRRGFADPGEIDAITRRIAGNVCLSARLVPEATCLTRALAAQILLGYEGLPSTLRIGVAPAGGANGFRAHAWLECEGRVVVGGEIMGEYVPLPAIDDV